ncbi:MAG: hypothetical protein REJ50_08205, partial [Bordetella sp.]|nr:hypothetical protein [Bordetella sp.]
MQRQPHSLLAPAPQVFTPRLLSLALAAALGGAALSATAQPLTPTVVSTPNAGFTYNLSNPAGLVVTAAGAITATDDQIRTVSVTIDVDLIENNGSIGTPTINQGIVTTKTVGLFDNRGTITAGIGLMNMGNITSLRNSGTMYGTKDNAILNQGSIVSLENTGEGVITAESGKVAIRNAGTIGTLTNGEGARIEGKDFVAITNAGGVIDKIVNAGTIESVNWANGGAIENFLNGAEIGEIDNSGLIKGATGLINQGVFGNIINSGTIYGSKYAIRNSGTMGTIDNSGSMYGTIENTTANDLVINGGVSRYGTLSALGNDPLIVNRNANVVFGQGKLQLFGDIDAGGHAVRNQTATLRVSAPLKIIGSYEQKKDATLELGVNEGAVAQGLPTDSGYGRLTVTNNTTLEAGTTVTLAKLKGYAFAQGQRFVAIATQGHAEYNLESLKTAAEGYSGNLSASTLTDQDASYLILTVGQSGGPDVITHPTPGGTTTPSTGATTNNATASLAGLFRYQGVNQDLLNVFNPAAALGDTE